MAIRSCLRRQRGEHDAQLLGLDVSMQLDARSVDVHLDQAAFALRRGRQVRLDSHGQQLRRHHRCTGSLAYPLAHEVRIQPIGQRNSSQRDAGPQALLDDPRLERRCVAPLPVTQNPLNRLAAVPLNLPASTVRHSGPNRLSATGSDQEGVEPTLTILKQVNAHLARKGLLLKRGSIVDATIIAAPSSTKNNEGARDPEMHQTKKGQQWHFGMKAHIGVDADSGLVHTVTTTAANEADVEQVADLLHGKEEHVWADSGYRGAQSRVDREGLQWHIAARPSDIAKMPEGRAKTRVHEREHRKASMRAKVEHPFRVIKRQFGLLKVRFRGLQKNTAHLLTLFALSNLWMARRQLMTMMGAVRPKAA
jgi:IS5 family transposase